MGIAQWEERIGDKLVNKISGANIETVLVSLEDFMSILDKEFLSCALNDEEYEEIYTTCKGSHLKNRSLISKSGKYELYCHYINNNVGILNPKDRFWVAIKDLETEKHFKYRAFGPGDMKKTVKNRINEYKMGIAPKQVANMTTDEVVKESNNCSFCTRCGNKIDPAVRFCVNCGEKNILFEEGK